MKPTSKMMKKYLFLSLILFSSCSHNLTVVNEAGNPQSDVAVKVISRDTKGSSYSYSQGLTNIQGKIKISYFDHQPQSILLTKDNQIQYYDYPQKLPSILIIKQP
jgi:hypothetical protein